MPTANEKLLDATLRQQIDVRRFVDKEVETLIARVEKYDHKLAALFRDRMNTSRTQKRIITLLQKVDNSRKIMWQEFRTELRKDLFELAKIEVESQYGVIKNSLPLELELSLIEGSALKTLVTNSPFQGKLLKEWFKELETVDRVKIKAIVTHGIVEGETTDQIVRNLIGTKANKFADGVLSATRRQATAIVRTATNHVSNKSREEVFKANSDIISTLMWASTLDGRTCFTAGHLVKMMDGTKQKIETIRKGDFVIGGISRKPREILGTVVSYKPTLKVEFENGLSVQCTADHPFLTKDGWIDAKDLLDLRVFTEVSERKKLCWSKQRCKKEDKGTFKIKENEIGSVSSSNVSHSEVWYKKRKSHYSIQTFEVCPSVCFGDPAYFQIRNSIPQWLQLNKWWGRSDWENSQIKKITGRELFQEIQKRFGIQRKNEKSGEGEWAEGRCNTKKMVGKWRFKGIKKIKIVIGLQEKDFNNNEESKSTNTKTNIQDSEKTLGRPELQKTCEFGKRIKTVGASKKSRMGFKEKRKICKNYEKETRKTIERSYVFRKFRKSESNEEYSEKGTLEKNKGIKVVKIYNAGMADVFDIEVTDDHSFICEGLIVHNSEICRARDGQHTAVEGGKELDPNLPRLEPQGARPPAHINCLIGDSFVTPCGDISNAMKRFYNGEVITIRTAGNNEITCTPNHPILTDRGWVPAQFLKQGGSVLRYIWSELPFSVIENQNYNRPALIEEIANSFFKVRGEDEISTSRSDFHGDGVEGEISIVGADCLLKSVKTETVLNDKIIKCWLQSGSGIHSTFNRFSSFASFFKRGCSTLYGKMSIFGLFKSVRIRSIVPNFLSRFASMFSFNRIFPCHFSSFRIVSYFNSTFFKNSIQNNSGKLSVSAQVIDAFTGNVALDQIVNINRSNFSGHVYNLETVTGVYLVSSGNIITHNCRSIMVPVFDDIGVVGTRAAVSDTRTNKQLRSDWRRDAKEKVGSANWKSLDSKERNALIRKERNAWGKEHIGMVPAKTTYQQFLSRQSAPFQDEVLGKSRGILFRKGGVTLDKFVDKKGNGLTLVQLRAKIPSAFEKAGL